MSLDDLDSSLEGMNPNHTRSRRKVVSTIGALIGSGAISQVLSDKAQGACTYSGITTEGCTEPITYWSDSQLETYTAPVGDIEYEGDLGSSIQYIDSYTDVDSNKTRVFHEIRTESEAVTRINEGSSWEDDGAIQSCKVQVTDDFNTGIYAEQTGDNVGIRPDPSGGSDSTYPGVVEEVVGLAVGEVHDYLDYGWTATQIVSSFLSDNPIDGGSKDNADAVTWDWNYTGASADSSYHCKFAAQTVEGSTSQFTINKLFDYFSSSSTTLSHGWKVYYDGSELEHPNVATDGGVHIDRPMSHKDAVRKSPNPPENPSSWTYVPIPEGYSPTRVKTSELSEHSPVRKAVDNEYVMRTRSPLWIKRV